MAGIEHFLGSGAVEGVGPALAGRIVRAFGSETMRIMTEEPERLLDIQGIGKKKLAVISESLREEREINELAVLLETHRVSGRYAKRLLSQYGADAAYVLEHEPYRMIMEIDGIGFKTADQIALAFGTDPLSSERLSAGLQFILRDMMTNGHVCIPRDELIAGAANILGAEPLQLSEVLDEAILSGFLVAEDYGGETYVYTAEAYEAELRVAARIREMAAMNPPQMHTHIQLFLDRREETARFHLADKQREAVEQSFRYYRRSRYGENDCCPYHHCPGRTGRSCHSSLRTYGTRGQTSCRDDGTESQNHSPAPCPGRLCR